ncbi:MAG: glycogen debranching N-terminal domain-containing protein [Gemmatimonadota bacterium]
MSLPSLIQLAPHRHTIHVSQGRTVLATALDGFVHPGTEHGLFVHETRLLSCWRWRVDGRQPEAVAVSNVQPHSWLGYYVLVPPGQERENADCGSGQVPASAERTLELRIARHAGVGVHEDVDVTNFSDAATEFHLELELDADFADLVEATSGERRQHGERTVRWEPAEDGGSLTFIYRAEHAYCHPANAGTARLERGVRIEIDSRGAAPVREEGSIRFALRLAPGAGWHACARTVPLAGGEPLAGPHYGCYGGAEDTSWDRLRRGFLRESTGFHSGAARELAPIVVRGLQAAKRDLASLRLHDLDHRPDCWVLAAGLPAYVALYGRDVLTASWQMALAGPETMAGALEELPRWQGRVHDDWRDEDPGRMLHEAHTGPLEMLRFNPRERYYGSVTTSPAYAVVLSEYWHWTGDLATVRRLAPHAMRAIRWMDEHGDLDGDGLYEYRTRSPQGTRHQAWKDSADAIVDEDGSQVAPPIATCEEQGFAYLAKRHMAELLFWLDDREEARRLFREAGELKERFNERFWMEDERFVAMGLDAGKRPIRSLGSNAGHCVATEVLHRDRVPLVVDRLFAPDLFSGWGVRTLSADHPAFNPYSYHRGSVWPVEQAAFALGLVRYDLSKRLEQLVRGQVDALALFANDRLPEVFSGHARDERTPFPAFYPRANSPQAWSSSALLCMVQSLLGLYPYAPLNLLVVNPHLPEWLPELTLERLRVGEARVTLRFRRRSDGTTNFEVVEKRGRVFVVRQASPWSLTETWPGRLKDLLASLLP